MELVRRALIWCVETLMANKDTHAPVHTCRRCGHHAHFHRQDVATSFDPDDQAAEFRCTWPMPDGPPVRMCECPDYLASPSTSGDASSPR